MKLALLAALVLPTVAFAQVPVKESVVVSPAPSQGLCDAKFLPLTDANVKDSFAAPATREALKRFLTTVGALDVEKPLISAVSQGKATKAIRVNPKQIFHVMSWGTDGSVVGPLLKLRLAEQRDEDLLTGPTVTAYELTVRGAETREFYLIRESCALVLNSGEFDTTGPIPPMTGTIPHVKEPKKP